MIDALKMSPEAFHEFVYYLCVIIYTCIGVYGIFGVLLPKWKVIGKSFDSIVSLSLIAIITFVSTMSLVMAGPIAMKFADVICEIIF